MSQRSDQAQILEEICQLKETRQILWGGGAVERMTGSELTILSKKITAGLLDRGSSVFKVSDTASEDDINRWLEHPGMDGKSLVDQNIVNIAAQAPIPTKMMAGILKKLLGGEFDNYYKIAETNVGQSK